VVLIALAGSGYRFAIEMPIGPLNERHRVSSVEAMTHPFFGRISNVWLTSIATECGETIGSPGPS
jgi:hypothetical protein